MNRLWSNSRGGPAFVALASLGVMFFALVVSASASKDRPVSDASSPVLKTASTVKVLSTANMPLDNRAAVAAAKGSGGGIAGCPASSCAGGDCTLTQSLDTATNGDNQVACGIAKMEQTTANGWARCYDLVNEGVPVGQNLTINSVTFGVQQASIDGINIDVVLYLDCNGCPPDQPGGDAEVLATQSLVVNMADVGSMITVEFPAGPVVAAGSDLIVEIVSVDDGTVPPEFQFRAMSNLNGQCGPSYIRTPDGDCGLVGWVDLASIGFPDAHLIQVISATVGGVTTLVCPKVPEACAPGAGSCQEPNGTPGCDDEDCCAGVCDINPACCSLQWDALCVQIASKLAECAPGPPTCDVAGDPTLTQSLSQEVLAVNGIACVGGGITTPNFFARSYNLSAKIPGQAYTVHCVEVGVEINTGSELVGTISIYVDTDGGAPTNDMTDLDLLGSTDVTIPPMEEGQILLGTFDPPIVVPANSAMVVELFVPQHIDGGIWPGTNDAGETAPSYLMAPDCALTAYTTFEDIGFPGVHWVQNVIGTVEGGKDPCPWDLNGSGDVGILDLLALLAAWGPNPGDPADFDGDGTVGILDLLTLLANWGACP